MPLVRLGNFFDMIHIRISTLMFAAISTAFALFAASQTHAQDILITKAKTPGETTKRKGTIESWQGSTIRMLIGSREREFDTADVIDVQTNWPDGFLEAKRLLSQRKFGKAFQAFKNADTKEERKWVRHEIAGGIIQCLQATGNHAQAAEEFISVVESDPQTRLFHLIPLQWVPVSEGAPSPKAVSEWLTSKNSAVRLLGASWQKTTAKRSALDVLQALLQDENRFVVHLATAQLWDPLSAKPSDLKRWTRQLNAMPQSLRAGPYIALADAQSRNKLYDPAAVNFMRIPVLYATNRSLSAPALYSAGRVLQNAGRQDEAKRIWNELRRDYPASSWAERVSAAGK